VNSKRSDILNHLNNNFNQNEKIYRNLNWSIKSIVSANKDNFYQERYSDVEFLYNNV